MGCREQYNFVVSDPCCLRCLFIDPRGGRCQAEQFQNRRTLRAGKAAVAAADIVGGNSPLLVGRPCQRDQCFLPGHEMGDLYGIAHSIDVRHGGFHLLVDSDAATNAKFESGIFCQMRIRGNTDGQQHHIRMQWLTPLQQGQHGISVLPESGDSFTQPQSHTVSAHFRMDKAGHVRVQRSQKLLGPLDDGDGDAHFRKVFRHFQSDKAAARQNRGFRLPILYKAPNAEGVFHGAQRENALTADAGKRRNRRLCAGCEE